MSSVQAPSKGESVRCPHCGTLRLQIFKRRDRIENMYGNSLLNRLREKRGDTLYHCVFCRLQFYDPRKPLKTERSGNAKVDIVDGDEQLPKKLETAPALPAPALEPLDVQVPALAASAAGQPPEPQIPQPKAALRPEPAAPAPAARPMSPPSVGTLLTAKVTVRGTIHSGEDLYIDGPVDGTVTVEDHRVTIGPNAKVKANVKAAEVEVHGTLRGNSHIRSKMTLRNGSSVVGDIRTGDIMIEDGAHFKGLVELTRTQPKLPLG
jgi:cytoskeletal protein CcmA (bactofilin family)/DNA-directed RNA polymerase subunit RPC12/RpoP